MVVIRFRRLDSCSNRLRGGFEIHPDNTKSVDGDYLQSNGSGIMATGSSFRNLKRAKIDKRRLYEIVHKLVRSRDYEVCESRIYWGCNAFGSEVEGLTGPSRLFLE